jgi:hypothetical protein
MKRITVARRATKGFVAALLGISALGSIGFGVYTVASQKPAPAAPVIQQHPSDPTTTPEATFTWTEATPNVTFQCKIDGGSWLNCSSPYSFTVDASSNGTHQFSVRAVDSSGDTSANAGFSWKVNKIDFGISGSVTGLYPGIWRPITVSITNPNNFTIYVTQLNVSVSSSPASCTAGANILLGQSTISSLQTASIPANSTTAIPDGLRPQIQLRNLPTNQDPCKGAIFNLSYTGTATK